MVLSILIINFNGKAVLAPCLDSILAQKLSFGVEVIIVDNASTDGSVEAAADKKYEPLSLTVVRNTENVGFAKANNQAAHLAKGDFLWLLNNDTLLVDPNTLEKCVDFAKHYPDFGAMSPFILNPDKTPQFPGKQKKNSPPYTTGFLVGTALFMRRDSYLNMGGLDENFLFYTEDLDLSKRLIKYKKKLYIAPDIRLIHLGGQSTAFVKPQALIEGYRGGLYFAYKHYPSLIAFLYRILLAVFVTLAAILYAVYSYIVPAKKVQAQAFLAILRIIVVREWVSPKGHFKS
jgi:GT2 family glycosyltransferase